MQKELHNMDSEELLELWRDRRGEAGEEELHDILHHMEDAEIEMGSMATNGMPFPGEVTGGGKNKEIDSLNKAKSHLAMTLVNGGTMPPSGQKKRPLTEEETASGMTESGVPDCTVGGKRLRKLTKEEMSQGLLLVHRNYTESDIKVAQAKLEAMKAQHSDLKEERAEERHMEVQQGIADVKDLIMNPLKGLAEDSNGQKRKLHEIEHLVAARRKQEDMALKKLREEEEQATKDKIQNAKREHEKQVASIKVEAEKAKAELQLVQAEAKKAEADAKKAEAAKKVAEADAKKAEADLKAAEADLKAAEEKTKAAAEKAKSDALKSSSREKKKKEKKDKEDKKDD